MELANCVVMLSGNLANQVSKQGITPPELLVLQKIHGVESVVEISPTSMDRRNRAGELERLKFIYKEKVVTPLFPHASMMPTDFRSMGLTAEMMQPAKEAPKPNTDQDEAYEQRPFKAAEHAEETYEQTPFVSPAAPASQGDDGEEGDDFEVEGGEDDDGTWGASPPVQEPPRASPSAPVPMPPPLTVGAPDPHGAG